MQRIRTYLKRGETEQVDANKAVNSILRMLHFEPTLYAVFEIWDKEAARLVRGSEAVGIQGTRLFVRVPSAIHKQELLYSKDRLVARVNQALGRKAITDVQFEHAPSVITSQRDDRGGFRSESSKNRYGFRRFG